MRADLLVVGGGTAGLVTAQTAAMLGADVVLVERDRTGGDCLWTGCVPSKALLTVGRVAAEARGGGRLGVHSEVTVDFAAVMRHVHAVIAAIEPDDSPETLAAAGVRVLHGHLRFTGSTSADIDGRAVAFGQAVVCTGSEPSLPALEGLAAVGPLTSDTVWDLDALPPRLCVLGGGTIGSELAQGFARLGSSVTLVESARRILGREDPEASAALARALDRDGVSVRTGARPLRVSGDRTGGVVHLDDGAGVAFDRLLVCTGRAPRSAGLGLDVAGVEVDEMGHVRVDARLRTTNPAIWAAGDVTPHPKYTHTAGVNGSVVALNAILGLRRTVESRAVPRVTFTSPEVGSVGIGTGTDVPATRRRSAVARTVVQRHVHVDRAVAESETDGFTKLALDRRGRILGATVVGPRAGETLGELSVAVRHRMSVAQLTGTTHAYPTFSDAAWSASIDLYRSSLQSPGMRTALAALRTGRSAWVEARGRRAARRHRSPG